MTTIATTYQIAYNNAVAAGSSQADAQTSAMNAAMHAASALGKKVTTAQTNQAIAMAQQNIAQQATATSTPSPAAATPATPTSPTATSPSKANYNYFIDTAKMPTQAKNSNDASILSKAFLSQSNIDKVASFIDDISDAEMNMDSQTSQWIAAERMGFNAKPKLHDHVKNLSKQDPDRVVMYRGIFGDGQQGADWAEQYKNGARFAGKGYLGDGDYFQLSYNNAKIYAQTPSIGKYSNGGKGKNGNIQGSIVVASFNPSKVKMITSDALKLTKRKIMRELEAKEDYGTLTKNEKKVMQLLDYNNVKNKQGKSKTFATGSEGSLGTLATMLGYDAIYAKDEGGSGNDYYVVLNRSILDVKKGY